MKKILVPCDFYEPSREAFKFAIDIAKRNNGEIYVLKVTELPVIYEPGLGMASYAFEDVLLDELKADATAKLDTLRSEAHAEGLTVELLSEVGPVVPSILSVIDRYKIDLVVMGTHGSRGWMEPFLGSNTERIVRNSPVPVFSIRKNTTLDSIKNILMPSILSPDQPNMMSEVLQLTKFFGASLHVLYVNTPANFRTSRDLNDKMKKFVDRYKLKDAILTIYNDYTEEKGIVNYMKTLDGCLLAMPTHGRKGLAHLLSGSITEDVLKVIETPIWTCLLRKVAEVNTPVYEPMEI